MILEYKNITFDEVSLTRNSEGRAKGKSSRAYKLRERYFGVRIQLLAGRHAKDFFLRSIRQGHGHQSARLELTQKRTRLSFPELKSCAFGLNV